MMLAAQYIGCTVIDSTMSYSLSCEGSGAMMSYYAGMTCTGTAMNKVAFPETCVAIDGYARDQRASFPV